MRGGTHRGLLKRIAGLGRVGSVRDAKFTEGLVNVLTPKGIRSYPGFVLVEETFVAESPMLDGTREDLD